MNNIKIFNGHYKNIFNSFVDALFIETLEGKVLECNNAACLMYGYSRNELIGMNASNLVAGNYKSAIESIGAQVVGKPVESLKFEVDLLAKRKDKTIFPVELMIFGTKLDDNNYLVVCVKDITSKKKSETLHSQHISKIRQLQKLETLGMLATSLSNDFNNILTGIMGYAELIKREAGTTESIVHKANKILEISRKAGEIIQQLMLYTGNFNPERQKINIKLFFVELKNVVNSLEYNNCKINFHIDSVPQNIFADYFQLQKALLNLINNSYEAISGNKGEINISVSLGDKNYSGADLGYFGSKMVAGRYILISVKDNGCGMNNEQKERAFEPFYTSKNAKRGLGLTAVLNMVRCHRGAVYLQSKQNAGTKVSIMLPIQDNIVDSFESGKNIFNFDSHKISSGVTLVVDDEEEVRRVLLAMLSKMGYKVIEAHNGQTGIELFKKHISDLKMVILDIAMAGIDGIDVLRQFQWLNPVVPVIICSGLNVENLKPRLENAGASYILKKPFTLEELEECLLKVKIKSVN